MPSQQLSERPATSTTATTTGAARHEFRGATIEEAIANATEELGPHIRIVEANRIRRGGVGGFFATDLGVEVVVEADDDTPIGTDTEPDRSDDTDDLLDEMRRLGIDVEQLGAQPTPSASSTPPAPTASSTTSASSTPSATTGLDALIDNVQHDERSFAARTLQDRAEPAPAPSFLATFEQELQADRNRPESSDELPRRDRLDDTGSAATGDPRQGTRSLAVSSELTGPIADLDGSGRPATQPDDEPPMSITRLASRLGAGIQLAELPRASATTTAQTDGPSTTTAANMAAHIEAIADLPRARREGAAIASAVADPTTMQGARSTPMADTGSAPAGTTGTAASNGSTATERVNDGSDPTTIGRELAADAARSVITQLAELDADHLRPADLRSITVSVTTPTGNTISIIAELGEVTS